jgi:hypothetical protein
MPQLDFREALSTPDEIILAVPATVPVVSPQMPADSFLREVGLSRPAWANIVFVAIAAVGGIVCAFYFFNGGDLLRAAAAWPAEFLYPRPLSTENIEAGVQPNAVDQFTSDSTSTAKKNGEAQDSSDENLRPAQLVQFPAPTETLSSNSVPPPVVSPIVPPILPVAPPGVPPIVPVLSPGVPSIIPPAVPAPDSIVGNVNPLVTGADTFSQSVYQTVNQTVDSVLPKKVSASSDRRALSSTRKKVADARQKASTRVSGLTSMARSSSHANQQLATQLPSSGVQNQTMFGGGMGAGGGIGAVGSAGTAGGVGSSSAGAGGVGTAGGVGGTGVGGVAGTGGVGGVGGVGGLGGGLGGVGGLGGGLGGLGGGLGGTGGLGGVGGHH